MLAAVRAGLGGVGKIICEMSENQVGDFFYLVAILSTGNFREALK